MTVRTPGSRPGTTPPVPLDTVLELPEPSDTEALGERLATGLRAGDLVVLSGPLGAGKTAFIRGLARGLGVAGPVTSPTFVIAREHRPLPGGAGVALVHVDAYRLGATGASGPTRAADIAAELDDLDLDTDLAEAVVAVEWGEGVAERLAARHVLVRLDRRPDDVRVARVHRVEPGPDTPGHGCGEPGTPHPAHAPHGGPGAVRPCGGPR
jgi:tRNA threonylcarbamoyladenosine biosynthesis protein TsaE